MRKITDSQYMSAMIKALNLLILEVFRQNRTLCDRDAARDRAFEEAVRAARYLTAEGMLKFDPLPGIDQFKEGDVYSEDEGPVFDIDSESEYTLNALNDSIGDVVDMVIEDLEDWEEYEKERNINITEEENEEEANLSEE